MFARKLKNRSRSISIQVISKNSGRYHVVQTVGTAKDPDKIERLWQQAQRIARNHNPNQGKLFAIQTQIDQAVENTIETLSNASVRTIGPELIFGTLFDRMGFNQIPDELFRHLVIARLAYPTSKLKTVDYLYRYRGTTIGEDTIYRFLDKLRSRHKEQAEKIVYQHTKKHLRNISIVFYDMTTLYFETEDEDDLRKIGFSKDGKFQKPQIMLGLLVGQNGLPIGYDIFEGNTFEGHTLLPTLDKIQKKYGFKKPVVVADAALLSKNNLERLAQQKYKFIIGARIKNESDDIKTEILQQSKEIKDGDSFVIKKPDSIRLIVTYSNKRAAKDAYNREKGLRKLRKQVRTGRLTKESINNRGYNKFLKLTGKIKVAIDESKIKQDQKWDGLKGYMTNTYLSPKIITENYGHLWQIEKAFRISKTDLRIRPIYHYLKQRIEAHICIVFVAYAIYKELEGLLQRKGVEMTAKRAGELTHNMYELHYTLPDANERKQKVLNMDEEQQLLYAAVHR